MTLTLLRPGDGATPAEAVTLASQLGFRSKASQEIMDNEKDIAAFSNVLDSKDGCFLRAPSAVLGAPLACRLGFMLTELQICHDDDAMDKPGWKDVKISASLQVAQEVGGRTRVRLKFGGIQQILEFLEMCAKGSRGFLEWEHRPAERLQG